jgi:hypothetical protein
MDILEKQVLLKFIRLASTQNLKASVKNDKINFRCNICGDGIKDKKKKSGWILEWKNDIWYKCFNSPCVSMKGKYWLKKYFPYYYQMYINEILQYNQPIKEIKVEVKKEPVKKDNVCLDKFIPILKGKDKIFEDALDYCIKRKIPEEVYEKWYVALKGKYKDRLIIPFYNKNYKIYFWQGRALYENELKYLNKLGSKEDIIYGIDNININKPVIILEGVIDSLFIDNAISVLSVNYSEVVQEKLDKLDSYYLFDDDDPGREKSLDLLEQKKKVFLWKKFKKDNGLPNRDKWDINDFILYKNIDKKLTFEQLKLYFTNNYLDKIYLI